MARKARILSNIGIYHVLLRGVDRLFAESADYAEFTSILERYADGGNMSVFAYSLLKNRVHLVICSREDIGRALKPVCTSYARYFNRTHGGNGKLFYDRFKSEPINTEEELYGVVAFVNSVSAKTQTDYPYCSLSAEGRKICNRDARLSADRYESTEITAMYLEEYDSLPTRVIDEYIYEICGVMPDKFGGLTKAEQEAALEKLTKRRWIAKTKLYSMLGVKKTGKKEAVQREEKEKLSSETSTESKRELSVWLL